MSKESLEKYIDYRHTLIDIQ